MMSKLLTWFRQCRQEKPSDALSGERLEQALTLLRNQSWNLKQQTLGAWGGIVPPNITRKFIGWTKVRNSKTALWINENIQVVEAACEWNFSVYVLLKVGTPFLQVRREGIDVKVVAIDGLYHDRVFRCNSVSDFWALPVQAQAVMHDMLSTLLKLQETRTAKLQAIRKTLERC